MMGDIMCIHQAIKQPDAWEFENTVMKEVEATMEENN